VTCDMLSDWLRPSTMVSYKTKGPCYRVPGYPIGLTRCPPCPNQFISKNRKWSQLMKTTGNRNRKASHFFDDAGRGMDVSPIGRAKVPACI
jgi:hypothetical protein